MKGGKLRNVQQRVSILVALLALFQLSFAANLPSDGELHALTDLADTNAAGSMYNGGPLESWNFDWDANGNWIGGNPCKGYRGLRCWSTGNLSVLNAPRASFQGPISPAFGNLTLLSELTLAENQLSGDLAPVLSTLTSMKNLRLQGNNFTGNLQSNWVQRMPLLQQLKLARNLLDGFIPTGVFTNLIHLNTVDLSNNSFTGPVPDDLVSLPSLASLLLAGNNFNGTVPPSLSNSTLSIVDLSGNSLSGFLPTDWNTPNLTYLDLSGNNLSGPIPQQLLNVNVSTNFKLNLAENNFVGNISTTYSRKFGCNAFSGNPGLVMEDSKCINKAIISPAAVTPPSVDSKKSKGLNALTIVALTMGDVALLLMSVIGFVLFCIWWRKKDIHSGHDGDMKTYMARDMAWPTASKGDLPWPAASKGEFLGSKDTSLTTTAGVVTSSGASTGPLMTTEARSSFATKPEVKPALKSVVGTMTDPTNHSMTADLSISESFSCGDFGTNIVILDTTLMLEFDDLLRSKALVLGAGSHGVVYMACLDDGEMLAIKRIEELALPDERAFGRQCEQLAEVLHPNLLQLRGYCWSSQEKLLISDYMRNGSVHSLLHEGKSSPEEASIDWATRLKIAVGTARAVAHLHDSDMVHGNIKASNVLLDELFEPRVSDFGMETLLQRPDLQKHSDASDGYLAPELCAGTTRRRTQDGDVYSLGVFLLELLTGRKPVESGVDLPTWVQEMVLANRTVQLFDPALTSMHILPAQDVLEFLELAQACVSTDAAARPSITIVLRTLESIVPGSTAPRSFVKDDNIDSDLSLRETPDTRLAPSFVIPIQDGDDYDDDDESHSKDTLNPFMPGFLKPLRVPKTRQEKSADKSGNGGSPVSSSGHFYSDVSTPTTSPLALRKVGDSPFVSIPLQ
ncbi:unnamed protein product [Calypogeia fissa]